MNATATTNLILSGITTFSLAVLAILASVLVISIGFLVFKYGWSLLTDKSVSLFGYYLRSTPYK